MTKEYKAMSKAEQQAFLAGKPKVYLAIVEDRRVDIGVEVFTDREKAIEYAKGICKEYAKYPQEIIEKHIPAWEFLCYYSSEDCVRVEVKILDAMEDLYGSMS